MSLYSCVTCGKNFKTFQRLQEHRRRVHGSRYTCESCTKTFSRIDNLKRHRCHSNPQEPIPSTSYTFEEDNNIIVEDPGVPLEVAREIDPELPITNRDDIVEDLAELPDVLREIGLELPITHRDNIVEDLAELPGVLREIDPAFGNTIDEGPAEPPEVLAFTRWVES